jgi:protein gp37
LGWVILGGESGLGARPLRLSSARAIVQQCQQENTPCFVKQLGSRPEDDAGNRIRLRDPKGGYPEEWPEDLRVRQFPNL